jgi:tripartite-type tricarboxylate transporter receptor subunit TctC
MKFRLARTMLRSIAAFTVILAAAGLAATGSRAQSDYPNRPVRVILPFAAGGVADLTARLVDEKLGGKLGQNFVIENMSSAGGIAAARAALAGGTDGYTLTLLTNGTAISVPLFDALPFDPLKDFVPVSLIGSFETVFIANASSPYKTLGDFLKAAREKPGALNIGTINVGSTQNLTAELFKSTAGIDVVIVPFRSTPEVVTALLRNDIQMGIDFYGPLKPRIDNATTPAIATGGLARSPALPAIPTVQESGVPGFEVTTWNGLYAPTGTPDAIIEKLNAAIHEAVSDADLKKRALALGIDAKASTPAELDARMRSDIAKWGKVIEQAHIAKQ